MIILPHNVIPRLKRKRGGKGEGREGKEEGRKGGGRERRGGSERREGLIANIVVAISTFWIWSHL